MLRDLPLHLLALGFQESRLRVLAYGHLRSSSVKTVLALFEMTDASKDSIQERANALAAPGHLF